MNGFRQELLTRIIGMNGHITLRAPSGPLMDFDDIAAKARTVGGMKSVLPVVSQQAVVMFHTQAQGAVVHGIRADDLKKRDIIAKNIRAGNLDSFGKSDDPARPSDTVIMGRRMAEGLGLRIGDRFSVVSPQGNVTAFGTMPRQKSVTLVGVFEVGLLEYDKSVIFMPLDTAQSFFKLGQGDQQKGAVETASYGLSLIHI